MTRSFRAKKFRISLYELTSDLAVVLGKFSNVSKLCAME